MHEGREWSLIVAASESLGELEDVLRETVWALGAASAVGGGAEWVRAPDAEFTTRATHAGFSERHLRSAIETAAYAHYTRGDAARTATPAAAACAVSAGAASACTDGSSPSSSFSFAAISTISGVACSEGDIREMNRRGEGEHRDARAAARSAKAATTPAPTTTAAASSCGETATTSAASCTGISGLAFGASGGNPTRGSQRTERIRSFACRARSPVRA